MRALLLASTLLATAVASAGNRVGNGGNVVYCSAEAKGGEQALLLDFYEAGDTKFITASSSDYKKIVSDQLEVLRKIAPALSEQYRRRVISMEQEIDFKADVKLTDVKDSYHAFKPDDQECKVRQVVIRQDLNKPSGKRFLFDKKYWTKLSPLHQAGLILHEVIYEHFNKLGKYDSRQVRQLNVLIFSQDFVAMSAGKFWLFVKDLEVPVYP